MLRTSQFLALALLISQPELSQAQGSFKAGTLASACAPPPNLPIDQKANASLLCDAFLLGVTQGMFSMEVADLAGITVCMPTDNTLSPREAKSILLDALKQRPQDATAEAGPTVTSAIIKRYQCSK